MAQGGFASQPNSGEDAEFRLSFTLLCRELPAPRAEEHGQRREPRQACERCAAMPAREHLPGAVARLIVEASMRAIVAWRGLEQVGRRILRERLIGELSRIAVPREIV